MSSAAPSDEGPIFFPGTEDAFRAYLTRHPSKNRRSAADTADDIAWLTGNYAPPSEQKQFSRRHYVKKTFKYDPTNNVLSTRPKEDKGMTRTVIPMDRIMDIVEQIHKQQKHAGWDATWDAIKVKYYGILRSDVAFLLKRCIRCANDPRKRPKGGPQNASNDSPDIGYSGGQEGNLVQFHPGDDYHEAIDIEQHELYPVYQHHDSLGN